MRLIDADNFRRYAHDQLEMDKTYTADEILKMIDEQPTAELTDFERDFLKEFSFPL